MRLMGVDPSLCNTGWAVIDVNEAGEFLVGCGVIVTKRGQKKLTATRCEDDMERIDSIAHGLVNAVKKYGVLMSAVEGRAGAQSARAAEAMSMAFATVMTALLLGGVSRMIISPQKAKMLVANHIKGPSKKVIQEEVRYRLGKSAWDDRLKDFRPKTHEHIYDAAAVALASLSHPALLYIRRKEMMENGANDETIGVRNPDDLGSLHGPGRCG